MSALEFSLATHLPEYVELSIEEETDLIQHIEIKNIFTSQQQPPYTKEDEELVRRGDEAREKLILNVIHLIIDICSKTHERFPWTPIDDLISEGVLFVARHIDRIGISKKGHDWRRGIKFSTYLYRPLLRHIQECVFKEMRHHKRTKAFARLLIHRDTLIQKDADQSDQVVEEPKKKRSYQTFIRKQRTDDRETPLHTALTREVLECREILRTDIEELLPHDYYEIITRHFGIGRDRQTLEEIAEYMGCTTENIRQKENRTLHHLEQHMSRRMSRMLQNVLLDRLFEDEEDELEDENEHEEKSS